MGDCIDMFYPKLFKDISEVTKYYCSIYSNVISIDNIIKKEDLEMIIEKIYKRLDKKGVFGTNLRITSKECDKIIIKSKYIEKLKKDCILMILIDEITERRNLEQFIKIYADQ